MCAYVYGCCVIGSLLPYSRKLLITCFTPINPSVGVLEDNFGREGEVIPEHHINGHMCRRGAEGYSPLWRGGGGGGTTIVSYDCVLVITVVCTELIGGFLKRTGLYNQFATYTDT